MAVCKFFLQGNCRFGDNCRFEHRPPRPHESEYQEWRRNNPASYGGQTSAFGTTTNPDDNHATRKGWSEQIIFDSLKSERPSWPFTSFGAPFFRSLIQADLSFDEYHLGAVEASRNGTFDAWQREREQQAAQIQQQEQNILNNLKAAWQYNVNDPYYPSGKVESQNSSGGGFGGGQTPAFGNTTSQSGFGTTGQSAFGGGTSSFGKPANTTSFGSSPFGAMPASAFSLGSRGSSSTSNPQSAFGATPSTFGNTSTSTAFGQATNNSTFGATGSAPSAFGSTTSAFGAKPSSFGGSSNLPPAPLSSGLSSQPTFGQTSTLGASGLPPPPGTGFGSTPTFGQTSSLGSLGGNSTPAFGQASSFSSPFAGGLGRSLGGVTASTGTFGSKSTFGSFGQGNQPSAFAQAAGMGKPNAFMQATSQPSAFATAGTSAGNSFGSGSGNRFTVLGESTVGGYKDDEMADATPIQEKPFPFGVPQPSTAGQISQPAPPPPLLTSSIASPLPPQTARQGQNISDSATSLSGMFGGLSTKPVEQTQPQAPPPQPTNPPASTSAVVANIVPTTATFTPSKLVIDEMAAWTATEFFIGGIPESEPPVEVR